MIIGDNLFICNLSSDNSLEFRGKLARTLQEVGYLDDTSSRPPATYTAMRYRRSDVTMATRTSAIVDILCRFQPHKTQMLRGGHCQLCMRRNMNTNLELLGGARNPFY